MENKIAKRNLPKQILFHYGILIIKQARAKIVLHGLVLKYCFCREPSAKMGHSFQPVQREWRLCHRFHGDGHQFERIIICGNPIGRKLATLAAAVDDSPLAVFSHPDGNRLHDSAAAGCSVTRLLVDVQAVQAVGTMVAVVAAGSRGSHHPAADLAGKAVVAGMGAIISFFVLFSFVFSVHNGGSS